ncbi:MAG: RNA methyltransferase [Ruminococcus sp.]|nr:RNA methyltransferase [Ruminococcus sp.]
MGEMIRVEDLDREELLPYTKTAELELKRQGLFVAESPKVIRTALENGYEMVSMLAQEKYIKGQAADLMEKQRKVPVYTASSKELEQLTGYRLTQGVMSVMKRKAPVDLEKILEKSSRVAVLEDIMNQTNVGAIFRSAAALGFEAVLLTEGCSDPLFRRCVRVSMGTVFQVPWGFMGDSREKYIERLKKQGFYTAAMALRGDTRSIEDKELAKEEKLAVVLGTEGEGLREATIADCDCTVKIPMAEGVDSLNVAAASAVAFWQLRKK